MLEIIQTLIPTMRGNTYFYIDGIVEHYKESGATRRKVINALRKISCVKEISKEQFIVKGRRV